MAQLLWKTIFGSLKFKYEINVWPSISIPYILKRIKNKYSNRCMYTHVHSSTIKNRQNVDIVQISTNGWIDKQIEAYIYNQISFINKKEQSADLCYNMDDPEKHYAKWKKPETDGYILYKSVYMKYTE